MSNPISSDHSPSERKAAVSQVQMDLVSERIDRLHEKARQEPISVHDYASPHSDDGHSHENGDAASISDVQRPSIVTDQLAEA